MSDGVDAPILSYEQIRALADGFLRKYNPKKHTPVPIDEIVEFQFGIDIIPIPGLHESFEIDGFTSSDLQEITVDQYVYEHRQGRYRFTLAHEIGHIVLHSHIYKARKFRTTREWKAFVKSIPEETHSWLEYQAYSFAGLILVPHDPLLTHAKRLVREVRRKITGIKNEEDIVRQVVAEALAKEFDVSMAVIERRLTKDKIFDAFS